MMIEYNLGLNFKVHAVLEEIFGCRCNRGVHPTSFSLNIPLFHTVSISYKQNKTNLLNSTLFSSTTVKHRFVKLVRVLCNIFKIV